MSQTPDLPPMPYAQSPLGNPTSEIFNRLLKDRIIILGTDVNDDIANIVCAQMLYLEGEDDKDIWLYINSAGGSVTAGMAIYAKMQFGQDRKSVVEGKSVSVRVDLGGTRIINN